MNTEISTPTTAVSETLLQFPDMVKRIEALKVAYLQNHQDWIDNAKAHDPALDRFSPEQLKQQLLPYPGLTAMAAHEEANRLYHEALVLDKDSPDALAKQVTARSLAEVAKAMTGIDIHPGATIAPDLFIDHGAGVVIGETAIVGERCFFLQGVTLGGSTMKAYDEKVDGGLRRHPKIGDDVELGSFVTIYGASNIGNHVKIHTGTNLIDCEIASGTGEGHETVIGHGVDLRNAVVPASAAIYNASRPLVVVTDPDYQGQGVQQVMHREKSDKNNGYVAPAPRLTPAQAAKGSVFKEAVTAQYVTPDELRDQRERFENIYNLADKKGTEVPSR
jgi:serine acetyltransferase